MSATALVRSSSTPNVTYGSSSTSLSIRPNLSPTFASTSQSPTQGPRSSTTALSPVKSSPAPSSASPSKTPATAPREQPSPRLSTPGRWQHPALDEVVRRQRKTQFDNTNVWTIVLHVLCIFLTFFLPTLTYTTFPTHWTRAVQPYSRYVLLILRAVSVANIAIAALPLVREPDACEDIPLAPAQRRLLGLPPLSRPATPQEKEQYVTPPRYVSRALRTPSSSATSSPRGNASSQSLGVSPSASAGSSSVPQAHRIYGQQSRRSSSFGTTELGGANAAGTFSTPSKGARVSVGLNSKWLYEKGRSSPVGVMGWGTGSVFN